MGGYAEAKKCYLVGLYLVAMLRELIRDIGLFRNDGLAVSSLTSISSNTIPRPLLAPRARDTAQKKTPGSTHHGLKT